MAERPQRPIRTSRTQDPNRTPEGTPSRNPRPSPRTTRNGPRTPQPRAVPPTYRIGKAGRSARPTYAQKTKTSNPFAALADLSEEPDDDEELEDDDEEEEEEEIGESQEQQLSRAPTPGDQNDANPANQNGNGQQMTQHPTGPANPNGGGDGNAGSFLPLTGPDAANWRANAAGVRAVTYQDSGLTVKDFKKGEVIIAPHHVTNTDRNKMPGRHTNIYTTYRSGPIYSKRRFFVVLWKRKNHMTALPLYTWQNRGLHSRDADVRHEYVCVKNVGDNQFVNESHSLRMPNPLEVRVNENQLPMSRASCLWLGGETIVFYQDEITKVGRLTQESFEDLKTYHSNLLVDTQGRWEPDDRARGPPTIDQDGFQLAQRR